MFRKQARSNLRSLRENHWSVIFTTRSGSESWYWPKTEDSRSFDTFKCKFNKIFRKYTNTNLRSLRGNHWSVIYEPSSKPKWWTEANQRLWISLVPSNENLMRCSGSRPVVTWDRTVELIDQLYKHTKPVSYFNNALCEQLMNNICYNIFKTQHVNGSKYWNRSIVSKQRVTCTNLSTCSWKQDWIYIFTGKFFTSLNTQHTQVFLCRYPLSGGSRVEEWLTLNREVDKSNPCGDMYCRL